MTLPSANRPKIALAGVDLCDFAPARGVTDKTDKEWG
jgi:hypothetical protein